MRTILHCDVNNCFASIEAAMNPALRGLPIAVCGDPAQRRGIVLAKSEEAKRCGVKTGDPLWKARQKCPNIRFVPPHFHVYEEYSRNMRAYYRRWTPSVEPYGLDECWLDLTGCPCLCEGTGADAADRIRDEVRRAFGVTVSVGVSFTKSFAKLGSDMRKPDATTVILPSDMRRTVWPLPASELLGVGRSTADRLRRCGILTIGMIANADPRFLRAQLGKNGEALWRSANGLDDALVCPDDPARQSIGHGTTLPHDIHTTAEAWPVLCELAERTAFALQDENREAYGIQVYVRFADLRFRQFQHRLDVGMRTARRIADYALMMVSQADVMRHGVRALGIRMFALADADAPRQLSLFHRAADAAETREAAVDGALRGIRERFGQTAISRGIHAPPVPWCHPPGGPHGG